MVYKLIDGCIICPKIQMSLHPVIRHTEEKIPQQLSISAGAMNCSNPNELTHKQCNHVQNLDRPNGALFTKAGKDVLSEDFLTHEKQEIVSPASDCVNTSFAGTNVNRDCDETFKNTQELAESSDVSDNNTINDDLSENKLNDVKEILVSVSGKEIPGYISTLLDGFEATGASQSPLTSKPEWYDHDKFCLGQNIALKYFFSLQFSTVVCLLPTYTFSGGLAPLIFTGKSSNPFTAFKRYIANVLYPRTWYLNDIWDSESEAHKTIEVVRKAHDNVRRRMASTDHEEITEKITLTGKSVSRGPFPTWSPLHEKLREDFAGTCTYQQFAKKLANESGKSRNFISQMDLASAQFAFVGLFALYPSYFGAHNVTDDELEALLHVWSCIGYRLGIEDKYNVCKCTLADFRQRGTDMLELILKPMMCTVTADWEHMVRCFAEAINYFGIVEFEVFLLHVCNILNLRAPQFEASLTIQQKLVYYITQFILSIVMRIPGGVKLMNWLFELAFKRALTPEGVKVRKNKRYAYEENVAQ